MIKYLLLIPLAAWTFSLHGAHAEETSQHYPLSMAAARQTVTKWLQQNDYSYQVIPEPGGQLRIRSSNNSEKWLIELRPHSPLTTVVVVHLVGNEQVEEQTEDLIQHLTAKSGTLKDERQQPEIPAAILEKIDTVACIRANNKGSTIQFSGVFIDPNGLILCTAHDLKVHEEVTIISTIGTLFKGDIIKIDFQRDLALIQIKTNQEQAISLDEARNLLGMGEKVFSIGCPLSLGGTVYTGFINGPPRLVDNLPLWQAGMEIQPGSSGSPVFDGSGAFVAMIKGRHRASPGIGFLIPLEVIIDFLNEQLQ